ncbi:T9SS type A sorting domain-containing protein [Flavobacterium sp. CYK-4]|uniref:T9SS type A sorting domain-containing protein n=1 Tax=Flavobacterium lotistagni TaxID=2709660 RepID=UPI0014093827|nr:T9SS type A sorting domain-containing protein [Flavobacterium lotistagni]NHM06190.1 T9SS type A sorting domain-containing protein [Flavobacterium lotistagni]
MKRKLLILFGLLLFQSSIAQAELVGSNEYGRIFDIHYHPSDPGRLFALSLQNHILTSTDNGQNWSVHYSYPDNNARLTNLKIIDDHRIAFAISQTYHQNNIVLLNIDDNTIEHTFEVPIPNYPEDGGPSDEEHVSKFDINPDNTNQLIIYLRYRVGFGAFSRVYYTQTGGTSWDMIYSHQDNNMIHVNNVALGRNIPQRLYVALASGPNDEEGGLLISDDFGQHWTEKLPGVVLDCFAFHPTDPNHILLGTNLGYYGSTENLYRSYDGGDNWEIIPIQWNDFLSNAILDIEFDKNNPARIMVLEENEVVLTSNNFETNQKTTYGYTDSDYYYGLNVTMNPFNSSEMYLACNYYPFFSNDGGQTFTKVKSPFFYSESVSLKKDNQSNHLLHGVQFGHCHRNLSNLVETSYDVIPLLYPVMESPMIVYDKSNSHYVAKHLYGFIGNTVNIYSQYGATLEASFTTECIGVHEYLTGLGKHWLLLAYNTIEGYEYSRLFYYDPNDTNPELHELALPTQTLGYSLAIANGSLLINLGTKIYKLTGSVALPQWQLLDNGLQGLDPDHDTILDISQNPLDPQQVTLATTAGIYTSYSGGHTWQLISNHVVDKIVHSDLHPEVIIGAQYDGPISRFEIHYSKDSGTTWETLNQTDLYYIQSYNCDFNFRPDDIEAYIATTDLGVVKHKIDLTSLGNHLPETRSETLLYPVPTQGKIFVYTPDDLRPKSATMIDMLARKHQFPIEDGTLDISGLKSGTYYIVVEYENGQKTTHRVIKI